MNIKSLSQNIRTIFLVVCTLILLVGSTGVLNVLAQGKQEAPKQEAPKQEAPKQEAPKQEAPKQEAPKQEAPKQEAPAQQASPSCPDGQLVNTIDRCVGTQMCKINIHRNADCSTYEGGTYLCQNSAACGYAQPTQPALRLGCNDACTSNSQCNNDDANRACIGGFCRLSTNPSSLNCSPPAQPTNPPAQPTAVPTQPVVAAAQPTVTPAQPTPTPTGTSIVQNCPSGQVLTMQNSVMVCVNVVAQGGNATANATGGSVTINNPAAPQAVAAAPARPVKVAGVSAQVTELPKTGLPVAAWLLSGLLPLGVGLKRFGANTQKSESAKYIWQTRQYLKDQA